MSFWISNAIDPLCAEDGDNDMAILEISSCGRGGRHDACIEVRANDPFTGEKMAKIIVRALNKAELKGRLGD